MRVLLFTASFFIALQAFALNESTVFDQIKSAVLKGKRCQESGRTHENFWKAMKVKTTVHVKYWEQGSYDLHFSKFGCGVGRYGSVVIAPGRTEASIEFYETAMDFVSRGFSPVYVVDHVGQGFSPRLLEDNHKGHVSRFSDYVTAFTTFVKAVENDLSKKEGRSNQPLFFTSNSMGGAIGIGYFQRMGEDNPFAAAALLGPMIKVNYLGFPGAGDSPTGIKNPTWGQKQKYSELGAIAQARLLCKTLKDGCRGYATKLAREMAEKHGSAFVEGRRDFAAATAIDPEQVMTQSKARYDLRTFLWEAPQVKKLYKKKGLTNPQLGAPTVQWVKQTAKFNQNMRRPENLARMSNMPLKIITGTRDVRAYTPYKNRKPDLIEHVKFCNTVNMVKGEGTCEFLQIQGGMHEIYKESQPYRDVGFGAAVNHFLSAQ